jgi:excisionase family DNA binding protein
MTSVALLTIGEAGFRLRASENHVYRLVALGQLRAVDVGLPGSRRSKTRIREDDLAAYIQSRTPDMARATAR